MGSVLTSQKPTLSHGVSLSLPVVFPKEQVLYSQLQGSLLSPWRVLSLQRAAVSTNKIPFILGDRENHL